jgi:CRISPR-associated RAMP protein (TIGR02581 family)
MSRQFDWFDAFLHRTSVEGVLVARTGLRVGCGRDLDSLATDLPVLRGHDHEPFIPGSSLKGVVRAGSEKLLRGIAVSKGVAPDALKRIACDPLLDPCVTGKDDGDAANPVSELASHHQRLEQKVCLVCATYGAAGLASHVRFRDAHVVGPFSMQVRDGVAIDRDLGRVSGSKKYDFEIVEPGATFGFRVEIENGKDWQIGLLRATLGLLGEGVLRVGGFGSRGLGAVEVSDLTWTKRTVEDVVNGRSGAVLTREKLEACFEALRHTIQETIG